MRRLKILIILLVVISACIIVFTIIQFLDLRSKKIVSDLDMSQASIPTSWDCAWCDKRIVVHWKYQIETAEGWYSNYPVSPFSKNPRNDITVSHWIDQENGYVIELAIIDYKYPFIAQIYFYLNDPKDRLRKVFWNFTYSPQNIVPVDWNFTNNEADQYLVRCGDGTQDHCFGWFYQARYGQYYLLIHFYQDLSYKAFQDIVIAINEQFIQTIR
jgi:hypothetical protein